MGLILKSLAPYTGPYPVSTHDVELAPSPSRSRHEFSRARLVSTGQRALSLDSVLFTVFYPAREDSDNRSKPMPWLERPLSVTARGYAKFLAKPKVVVQALVYAFGAGLHLATRGTDLPVVRLDKPAPVVVFSHGLSGNRTTYSQYCGELASRGYVVVAIEHRDGSGPVSIVKPDVEDPQSTERIVDYIKEGDICYEDEQDRQPFIKFRGDQLEMRQAEIAQVLEILERVNRGETDDLERSNRRRRAVGDEATPSFRWKDLHGKLDLESNLTMAGHSFGGATTIQILRSNSKFRFHRGIALDPWADPIPPAKVELELDLSDDRDARKSSTSSTEDDRTTLVSTTTSDAKNKKDHEESLSDKGRGGNEQEASPSPAQPPSTQEREEEANEHGEREGISIPFLVINSEAFTLWKPHFYLVRDIVTSVRDRAASTWFFTILGSIHLSFSDLPLFLPSYLSPKAATTPASTSHTTIVDISVEFLDGAQQRRDGRLARNVAREGDEEYVNPNRGEGDKGPLVKGDGEDYARLHVKRNVSTQ